MLRFALLIILVLAGHTACRTTSLPEAETSVLADDSQTQWSEESKCEHRGGELIDGFCYCSDGTRLFELQGQQMSNGSAIKTCGQWTKFKYPNCYAKGGIAKKNDTTGHECFCPHGETINENGNQTCYQMFAAKNRTCSQGKGIILAADRVCRCMHGPTEEDMRINNTNCAADHKAKYADCDSRGGLTDDEASCKCVDGTYIHGNSKARCGKKWFFQEDIAVASNPSTPPSKGQQQTGPSAQSQGNKGQSGNQQAASGGRAADESNALCRCMYDRRSNSLIIERKADGYRLASRNLRQLDLFPEQVSGAICWRVFGVTGGILERPYRDRRGGCAGSWDYIPPAGNNSPGDTNFRTDFSDSDYCECKRWRNRWGHEYCGMFKPNGRDSRSSFLYWSTGNSRHRCTQDYCARMAAGSVSMRTYCKKVNGNPLWRAVD